MAEGGELELWKAKGRIKSNEVIQLYQGPTHFEGQMISSFHAHQETDAYVKRKWRQYISLLQGISYLIDCVFEPYNEEHILISLDMSIPRDEVFYLPIERQRSAYDISVSSRSVNFYLTHFRSNKATSTAFSRNVRYIAWLDCADFKVMDRHQKSVQLFSRYNLCSAISPCASMIALMKHRVRTFTIDIMGLPSHASNSPSSIETVTITESWENVYTAKVQDYDLNWSNCGKYIGVTYKRKLAIVNFSPTGQSTQHFILPRPHPSPATDYLASRRAFDFRSGENGSAVLAFATQKNLLFLSEYGKHGLGTCIAERKEPVGSVTPHLTNCLRFSNAEDLLAVALSSADIFLLHSGTLETIHSLQPAEFQVNGNLPGTQGFTCINFSCNDCFLVTGARDGLVRVWCVHRRVPSLDELCRRAIRGMCTADNMRYLPLPRDILKNLTNKTFWESNN